MNTDVIDQEDFSMPQMFDWIFFAIVLPVPVTPGLGLVPLGQRQSSEGSAGPWAAGRAAVGLRMPRAEIIPTPACS